MLTAVGRKHGLPRFSRRAAALADALVEGFVHSVRNEELRVLRPPVEFLGKAHLFLAKGITVSRRGVLLVGRPVTDDAVDNDQGWAIVASLKRFERLGELVAIVCVAHMQDVPAVDFEEGCDILTESKLRVSFNRDGVVVVDPTQIRETEM